MNVPYSYTLLVRRSHRGLLPYQRPWGSTRLLASTAVKTRSAGTHGSRHKQIAHWAAPPFGMWPPSAWPSVRPPRPPLALLACECPDPRMLGLFGDCAQQICSFAHSGWLVCTEAHGSSLGLLCRLCLRLEPSVPCGVSQLVECLAALLLDCLCRLRGSRCRRRHVLAGLRSAQPRISCSGCKLCKCLLPVLAGGRGGQGGGRLVGGVTKW
mmetsp:Transcript_14766/g.40100  ORF Transcript_14766/g.40100 Transcript_14766/m.40100 type:complete len:211 (-) Transcript_14766:105-737(-)